MNDEMVNRNKTRRVVGEGRDSWWEGGVSDAKVDSCSRVAAT